MTKTAAQRSRFAVAAFSLLIALFSFVRPSAAAPPAPVGVANPDVPVELQDIDIEEHPGAVLPRDVALRDGKGQTVHMGDYFDGKHPVVLMFAYYECPMLCSLVINGLLKEMKELQWTAGQEYRVVVVSFDRRDTPEGAAEKRKNYVGAYGREVGDKGFEFLTGDESEVRKLTDTVGFKYRWEETNQQFAHAAGAFVFTGDARLSRTLYGIAFPSLKLSLLEAAEGKIGTTLDKVILFCFHYDPSARGYVLAGTRIMKAGGALTVLLLGVVLFRFWRSERKKKRGAVSSPLIEAPQAEQRS